MFKDFVRSIAKEAPEIERLAEIILQSAGKKFLIISHDDADGITSGVLLARALRKNSAHVEIKLPPRFELSQAELQDYLKESDGYDFVFCIDKGSKAHYRALADLTDRFIVIDHHPIEGDLGDLFYLNPRKIDVNIYVSASHLVYMVLEYAGLADPPAMLTNLMGLIGDFAYKTTPWRMSDWITDFIAEAQQVFPHLFEFHPWRPTMFDVQQQEGTSLLHMMTELVNAVCGTGFQFFYHDRDITLRNLDPPRFIFQQLETYLTRAECGQERSFEEFLQAFQGVETVELIYQYYVNDWDHYVGIMNSTSEVGMIDGVHIYYFLGKDLRLIPMIGSVKLHEKAHAEGHEHAVIAITNILPDRIHTSLRGTGVRFHCGEMCRELTRRVKNRMGTDGANGGGHPAAAEFVVTDRSIAIPVIIEEIFKYLGEQMMTNQAKS